MADVTIEGTANATSEAPQFNGTNALVAVSNTVVYFFYLDTTAPPILKYRKSTNAGASWGAAQTVASSLFAFGCWFDKWTSGDTGTLIHIGYWSDIDGSQQYMNLNTSDDSLSSPVVVASPAAEPTSQMVTMVCKSRGGNLYYAYATDAVTLGFYRSTNGGAAWSSRTTPWEADVDDFYKCVLLPANAADNQDMWMVYGDQSANALTVKTYDDSANSWSETAIGSPPTIVFSSGTTFYKQVHAAIRHSDGHAIIVLATHVDNAAGDLMVFDWDGSSFTAKTNIITNADDWMCPVVSIDQNTDDLYVGYLGQADGGQTWTATVSAHYQKSTDDGSTWSGETSYDEGAADDYRVLFTSPSTPGTAAGLFIMSWFDDDDNDWWTNAVNAVVLSAAAPSVNITGVVATATAAGLDGTITAVRTASIVGEAATSSAVSLAGTVQIARSIAGELAVSTANGLAGSIQIARSITGELALATANALEGVITAQGVVNASITGEAATATAASLAGVVTTVRSVSISGEPAASTAASLLADIYESFTLNLAIAATNDDGWASDNGSGTGFFPTDPLILAGTHAGQNGNVQIWGRFTGISGLEDAQILSANYLPKYKTTGGTALTKVFLELAAAPAQPTSAADLQGRTQTTAGTDVDSSSGAPIASDGDRLNIDVTAQLQEIIDAGHDPSAIQVIWTNDGGAAGFNFIQIYDYSNSPSDAAELEIVYIPASSNATVTGEIAEATGEALAGTATAVRNVSISGELASANAATLDGTVTAVRITSISGELAAATANGLAGSVQIARSVSGELSSATANALEGVITAQAFVNASITGEIAEATANGLAGTVTTVRSVSIAAEASQSTAVALEGTVTTVRITSISGELANATANGLAGSIQVARSITAEIAQANAAALPGSIQVSASISGASASATADALSGTVTSVRISSVSGELASAAANALEATITAARVISVAGEISQATADALSGTVTTVRSVSIAGEPAESNAVALEGVVTTLPSAAIDGELATASASALEAVITTVRIVSISGEIASATANALEGVVSSVRIASLSGEIASANATAEAGTVTSVRIVLIAGESSTATANALEGTISTGAATNVTVSGEISEATADALAGAVSALRSVSIVGELATSDSAVLLATITTTRVVSVPGELSIANAAALAGTIVIVPVISVSISAEPSLATAEALAGTITIELIIVESVISGQVELEDLIDRQIWPDNVDPSGAIFPKSEPVPSGYIEPVEETNPSGFQKQSGRTELWNL